MSLIVDNFSTGYNKEDIVSSINISLNDKEWIGIIGSNGSGKSTFLKGIARVLKPYSGVVYLDEINVHESNTQQIAREISFLPQQLFNGCNLTVHELVSLGRSPYKKWWEQDLNSYDYRKVEEAIEMTNMREYRKITLDKLSGGQKQRAFLALALSQEPRVLLLDEPTTFLDINYQLQFLDLLKKLNRKRNISIIMVIHDINLAARYCDRIALLKKGKLVGLGAPVEVLTPSNIKDVFQVDICVISTPVGIQICTLNNAKNDNDSSSKYI